MTTTSVSLNLTFASIEAMHEFLNKTGNGSNLPIQRIELSQPVATTTQTNETVVTQVSAPLTPFDKLMIELNKEQWTLRSEGELSEIIGCDPFELLDAYGVVYITRRRRRDGATLIGLASRN